MMSQVKIADLVVEGLQTRAGVNDAIVRDYAKEMADGVVFDPPVVFFDGTKHYLADGFHRIEAMKCRGDVEVEADVREGTRTDAIRFALSANAKHGLKRTPADIRRCLEVAWENRAELFGGEPSHEVLASACAVSGKTVQRFFKRREDATKDTVHSSESVTLVSIDGKKRTSTKGKRTRQEVAPVEPSVIEKSAPKLKGKALSIACTAEDLAEYAGKAPVFRAIDTKTLPEISPYSGRTHEQIEKGLDRYNMPIPKKISAAFDESSLAIYDGVANCVKQALTILSDYGGKMVFRPVLQDFDEEYEDNWAFPGELRSVCLSLELRHPHCVCAECGGNRTIDGNMCDACHGHGFMSQSDYHWWMTNKINSADDEEWAALKEFVYRPFKELAPKVQRLREHAWLRDYNAQGLRLPKDGSAPKLLLNELGLKRLNEDGAPTDCDHMPIDDILAKMEIVKH